jgi:hypothetical protein
MPRVGFEPIIPVLEQAKTVHASDGAATVIGYIKYTEEKLSFNIRPNLVNQSSINKLVILDDRSSVPPEARR